MLEPPDDRLIRIGVFYDADDLADAGHDPAAGVSIQPLHRLFRRTVAQAEQTDDRRSQVVDAHWFHRAAGAGERQADGGELAGILANAGVVAHPVPAGDDRSGNRLAVSLALECFELAIHKRYSVVALVAANPAYLPLVRKLNTLGTRVLVVDVQPAGSEGAEAPKPGKLVEEATYAMPLRSLTDVPAGRPAPPAPPHHARPEPPPAPTRPQAPPRPEAHRSDAGPSAPPRSDAGPSAPPRPDGPPARQEEKPPRPPKPAEPPSEPVDETVERVGHVARVVLPKGFGFLRDEEGREWFFHRSGVAAPGFEVLNARDTVKFRGRNMPKGLEAFWVSPQTAAERARSRAEAGPEIEPEPAADARQTPPESEVAGDQPAPPSPEVAGDQASPSPAADHEPVPSPEVGPEPAVPADHEPAAPSPAADAPYAEAPEEAELTLEHDSPGDGPEPEITPEDADARQPEPSEAWSSTATGPSPDVPGESATFGEAPPAPADPPAGATEPGLEPVAADGAPPGPLHADPERSALE